MVMYAGRVAEEGPVEEVFRRPRHPYTQKLLAAFPNIHADRRPLDVIPGSPPDLRDPPPGCRFAPRCPSRWRLQRGRAARDRRSTGPRRLPPLPRGERWSAGHDRAAADAGSVRRRSQRSRDADDLRRPAPRSTPRGRISRSGGLFDGIRRRPGRRPCGRRHRPDPRPWRGPRARRRVGEGQDHDRPGVVSSPARPAGRSSSRARTSATLAVASCASTGGGSSSSSRTPTRRSTRSSIREFVAEPLTSTASDGGRAASPGRAALEAAGLRRPPTSRPVSARAVGRPAPARRHRRCDGLDPTSSSPTSPSRCWMSPSAPAPAADARPARGARPDVLFITHDLSLAWLIADRIAVMYLGKIMEIGPAERVIPDPRHPYTRRSCRSCPRRTAAAGGGRAGRSSGRDARRRAIPSGCRFHPRCPLAFDRCRVEEPPFFDLGGGHAGACWLAEPGRRRGWPGIAGRGCGAIDVIGTQAAGTRSTA